MMRRSFVFLAYGYSPILWASYLSELNVFDLVLPKHLKDSFGKSNFNWICKKDESPSLRATERDLYKFDQVALDSTPMPFRKGFLKSTCFLDPTGEGTSDVFCIFVHPTLNHGQGMVIVHRESTFEDHLLHYLDLEAEPHDPRVLKVVKMPEKGGAGAVAARRLQFGDPVARSRPVAIFARDDYPWETPHGEDIKRQAIHHLPLPTRAAIAHLYGRGETADEFLSNAIQMNAFHSTIGPDGESYGIIVLEPSRLNHACRPNVAYYIDDQTQILHMTAIKPIEPGEELTINYRSSEFFHTYRKKLLKKSYGFDCSCSHCRMTEDMKDQSDLRVLRLYQLDQKHASPERSMSAQDVQEFLDFCEKESLVWCRVTSNMAAAEFYNSKGNMTKVKEHAEVAKQFAQALVGNDLSEFDGMTLLLEAPEQHKSHFLKHHS